MISYATRIRGGLRAVDEMLRAVNEELDRINSSISFYQHIVNNSELYNHVVYNLHQEPNWKVAVRRLRALGIQKAQSEFHKTQLEERRQELLRQVF